MTDDADRWRRRVDREHRARLAAEEIAESTLRNLYTRQRSVQLLSDISVLANEATETAVAFAGAADLLRDYTEADVVHVWSTAPLDEIGTDGHGETLRSTGIWSTNNSTFAQRTRSATEGFEFPPGEGVPGIILAAGTPMYLPQIQDEVEFRRKAGMPAGSFLGFPVLVGGEVVAVFEILAAHTQLTDPELPALLSTIGRQLGQVVSRARLAAAQASERERLSSEVRNRTAELDAALRSARQLLDFRSDLVAALNHDLRTPLHQLGGALDALRERLPDDPDVADAQLAADELSSLVVELMELYRTDSAQAEHGHLTPMAVDAVVRQAVDQVRERLDRAGRDAPRLRVDVAAGSEVIRGLDVAEITAGIAALIDSLGTSGIRIIVISLRIIDEQAEVTVAPGTRSADRSSNVDSRGLPLARAHLSATRLGGHIRSSPARPNAASLVFPLHPSVTHEADLGRRVLLVDDNTATRQLAAAMLTRLGLETEQAVDGLEALAALGRGGFGLVFMDCNMPNLDGYQATSMIRAGKAGEQAAGVPIVALTADGGAGHWDKCRRFGMSDFLSKPFRLADLEEMVRRWLPSES